MYINKGKDKFMFLDINSEEMAAIFDAFNSGKHNMSYIIDMNDVKFMEFTGCAKDKIDLFRLSIKKKINLYDSWIKKIQNHVS